MRSVCVFQLPDGTTRGFMEGHLATAVFSAECIFGRPRVRLSARYWLDRPGSVLIVDVADSVGEHIAQVLVGCFTRDFGEAGFSVTRRGTSARRRARVRSGSPGVSVARQAGGAWDPDDGTDSGVRLDAR
jgi:hypothetical protein